MAETSVYFRDALLVSILRGRQLRRKYPFLLEVEHKPRIKELLLQYEAGRLSEEVTLTEVNRLLAG
jgi:hypothetical protein